MVNVLKFHTLKFLTKWCLQTVQTQSSLLQKESDHSLHCLSFLWAFWSTIWLTFIKPGIQVLPNFVVSFVIMTYISHSSAFVNVNMNFSVCLVYNTSLSVACLYQIGVWLYWLKITELLDCALVGVCAVIRSNTVLKLPHQDECYPQYVWRNKKIYLSRLP